MSESNVFKTPDAQMRQNLKLDPMEENLVELGKFRTEILGLSHRRISLRGIKVQYLTDADRKLYEKLRRGKLALLDIDQAMETLARLPNDDEYVKNPLQFLAFLGRQLENLAPRKPVNPEKITAKYRLD
ncbi:MAG: hypothetical protein AAB661_00770 [Patescibacteria group bacterium]